MTYNLTWMNESYSVTDLITNLNTTSGGVLGSVLLFVIWLVLLAIFRVQGTKKAMLVSGIITAILGVFFAIAGITPLSHIWFPIILFVGSLFYYLVGEGE